MRSEYTPLIDFNFSGLVLWWFGFLCGAVIGVWIGVGMMATYERTKWVPMHKTARWAP